MEEEAEENRFAASRLGEAPWGHLDPRNAERLTEILRAHVPEVFRATRVIEQRTGYSSEIGKNMMVDVLAHLSTLAVREDLDPEGQASQLSKIEEHLRRAIIEHPEEVVRHRAGGIQRQWLEYQREVVPFRERGDLRGIPRHEELDELRKRIEMLLESARSKKPDETTWEESLSAAASATEAAHLSAELADKLEQCIGAAVDLRERRRSNRGSMVRWGAGIAVAVALGIGSFLAGRAQTGSPGTGRATAHSAAKTTTPAARVRARPRTHRAAPASP